MNVVKKIYVKNYMYIWDFISEYRGKYVRGKSCMYMGFCT